MRSLRSQSNYYEKVYVNHHLIQHLSTNTSTNNNLLRYAYRGMPCPNDIHIPPIHIRYV